MSRRCTWMVWTVAAAALVVKAVLAWNTYGTNDIVTWESFLNVLRHQGGLSLYRADVPLSYAGKFYKNEVFNHPPLVICLIDLWGRLADWSGVPYRTILRLSSSLADLLSVLLVMSLSRRVLGIRRWCLSLIALAACPVSIFISGFHGNTDPIMMFLMLLSLYGLEVLGSPLLCGLALGLAMEIKIVPVIVVLSLLLYLRSWRRRMLCASSILISVLLPALPYLLADPSAVFRHILQYRSLMSRWGITFLLDPTFGYHDYGRLVVGVVILAASIWLNYPYPRAKLFDQWGVMFFVFLFLTPGFGIQYLAWLVPWVVTLGPVAIMGQYMLNGAYIFLVYNSWSNGLPWYFANSLEIGRWKVWLLFAQVPVWASIIPTLMAYRSRIEKGPGIGDSTSDGFRQTRG